MENQDQKYIPGTCNIGGESLAKRKRFALKMSVFTIAVILIMELFSVNKNWRLTTAPLFVLSCIGWLQAFTRFCVYFGVAGLFKTSEGKAIAIESKTDLQRDRMKAIKIILSGIAIGLALTVLYYFLPGQTM